MEGAGNAGGALHPRSRVQNGTKKRTRAYRFSGGTPAFPAQWLDGLWRALPGDQICLSPSSREYGFVRPVGLAKPPRHLTPTMRRQDHTLLPYALAPFVLRAGSSLTGPARPAMPFHADAAASTASPPAFVTMANAPRAGKGRGKLVALICPTTEAKFCPSGCFVAGSVARMSVAICGCDRFGQLQGRPRISLRSSGLRLLRSSGLRLLKYEYVWRRPPQE
jgi:hypothetical protein